MKLRLAFVYCASYRRGTARLGRATERDVAFAGQQSARRIKADPAGAGQIHLAPRVQIGEVDLRPVWAVEGFHVGLELDQVAGNEARGASHRAQDGHEQPTGI